MERKYSIMEQVTFVEDNLWRISSGMICLNRPNFWVYFWIATYSKCYESFKKEAMQNVMRKILNKLLFQLAKRGNHETNESNELSGPTKWIYYQIPSVRLSFCPFACSSVCLDFFPETDCWNFLIILKKLACNLDFL